MRCGLTSVLACCRVLSPKCQERKEAFATKGRKIATLTSDGNSNFGPQPGAVALNKHPEGRPTLWTPVLRRLTHEGIVARPQARPRGPCRAAVAVGSRCSVYSFLCKSGRARCLLELPKREAVHVHGPLQEFIVNGPTILTAPLRASRYTRLDPPTRHDRNIGITDALLMPHACLTA